MSGLEEIRERLIRLEMLVDGLSKQVSSSVDDRKWLIRIILGGLASAVLLFITKGGLDVQ